MREIRTAHRFCAVSLLFRGLSVIFMVLFAGLLGTGLRAQTISIKLVNGRNGHPMAHGCVNVGIDHIHHMLAIPTDKDGVALLHLTDIDAEVNTQSRWQGCGDFGVIKPVVKYSDTIGINAGYVLCQPHTPDYSWLVTMTVSTKKVIQSGFVTPNTCGKATALPKPGELILFVRPLTWWEKLKQ